MILIKDDKNYGEMYLHYCWIKNINRLLNNKIKTKILYVIYADFKFIIDLLSNNLKKLG